MEEYMITVADHMDFELNKRVSTLGPLNNYWQCMTSSSELLSGVYTKILLDTGGSPK